MIRKLYAVGKRKRSIEVLLILSRSQEDFDCVSEFAAAEQPRRRVSRESTFRPFETSIGIRSDFAAEASTFSVVPTMSLSQ